MTVSVADGSSSQREYFEEQGSAAQYCKDVHATPSFEVGQDLKLSIRLQYRS